MRRSSFVVGLVLVTGVASTFVMGCSGSSTTPEDDAGTFDSSFDSASVDAHHAPDAKEDDAEKKDAKKDGEEETDAASDSSEDTSADSSEDTGTDGAADSSSDAAEETASDSQAADVGTDSSLDSAADTSVDAHLEAGVDGSADTGAEAGAEAGADAHPDTSIDAPADTSVDAPADVSVDAPADTGAEAAADTGAEAGATLLPCTTVGQTGCVECSGSASDTGGGVLATCTPTEAQIVASDIKKGLITAAGPIPFETPPGPSCYACLNASGCLDDNLGDTGAECEDTTTPSNFTSGTTEAECQATLACILGTTCNSTALSACYCGGAPPSGTCTTDTTAMNDPVPASTDPSVIGGSCDVEISTGLAHSIADGIDILKDFTNMDLAAGRANAIFACGVAGKCAGCR